MSRNRAAALMIGVLVCVPLLALHHFGMFGKVAEWLRGVYESTLHLPQAGMRPFLPLQYGYYTLLAFVTAWICVELPMQSRKFGFILGAVFLTLTLSPVLAFNGVLFEPFSGSAAILGAGLLGIVAGGTDRALRRHRMRHHLVGRLSSDSFESLMEEKDLSKLTERREVTILSCRVLNHSDLAREMDPADLEKFSSSFLKVVAEFLVSKGAYLDACNVQRVRVLFGYPLRNESHAKLACSVALELRKRLVNLAQEMEEIWHKKPIFGASISTGEMSCGLFGFSEFQFFSAVGEALDFGDRLCAVNTVYGSHLLISTRTYSLVKDQMEVRPMEMVFTPRLHPVSEIYELLAEHGSLSEAESKARDAFWQGVIQLRKGDYKAALDHFAKAKIDGRDDVPLKYFIERVEAGIKDGTSSAEGKGGARHVRLLMPA
jgi:class 3 adenylate cyclase